MNFGRNFDVYLAEKSIPINALAAEIDVNRTADIGLASAIRLYVLAAIKAERDQKALGRQADAL